MTKVGYKQTEEHKKKVSETRKRLFKEGKMIPIIYWQGKHRSEETRKKLSEATKRAFREGRRTYCGGLKGKHHTEESRLKISLANRGKKHPLSEETKRKISNSEKGKKMSEEAKKKISLAFKGDKHPNWQGGKSFEPYGIEFNNNLKEQIRERDGYRCQECFRHQSELRTKANKPYKLIVHHIDFNKQNNISLNLISLCRGCHQKTQFDRQNWINYFKEKYKETLVRR